MSGRRGGRGVEGGRMLEQLTSRRNHRRRIRCGHHGHHGHVRSRRRRRRIRPCGLRIQTCRSRSVSSAKSLSPPYWNASREMSETGISTVQSLLMMNRNERNAAHEVGVRCGRRCEEGNSFGVCVWGRKRRRREGLVKCHVGLTDERGPAGYQLFFFAAKEQKKKTFAKPR